MSYQVLARKWRPKSFATLVGQEHVVKALSHALTQQRLHHAYLLTHETAEAMTLRGPRAQLVEIAGVGHAPTLMVAEQIEVVRQFLRA